MKRIHKVFSIITLLLLSIATWFCFGNQLRAYFFNSGSCYLTAGSNIQIQPKMLTKEQREKMVEDALGSGKIDKTTAERALGKSPDKADENGAE